MLPKAKFTMTPGDISSFGTQIPIFKWTRRVSNNHVEKIICVRLFATQFVEKIIYVEQLNEFIAIKDVFGMLDLVKLM